MAVIEMQGITKRFGTLVANERIDLTVGAHEIHALLGENGAGKTTLMKVLYGLYQPDEGQIIVNGQSVKLRSPADAIANGIGYVSQHFSLVPTLTVAENIVLGYEGSAFIQRNAIRRVVRDTAERFGITIDPDAQVRDLAVGQQQRVEILKALYRNCHVLILDEPTAVLTPQDTEHLFATLRDLQQQHLSVIIITHKLEEVMALCQQVTVLRLGKVVGHVAAATTTPQALATMMVGRTTVTVTRNENHRTGSKLLLQMDRLNLTDKRGVPVLRDLSLHVSEGEVVGIAGVAGNGQSELVAILDGMLEPQSGEVCVAGQSIPFGNPRAMNAAGVGRIPEDRLKGIVGDLSVAENLTLEQIGEYTSRGHLNHKQMQTTAEQLIRDFQIKANPNDRARALSGGNIQKMILARTLSRNPTVLVAAQPTRGLDVGATEYVHQKLLEQKERVAGVLVVSEDLDEILTLSDRILVIYEGQIVGEFAAKDATVEVIGLLMAGGKASNE